jgi:hypothetical protein
MSRDGNNSKWTLSHELSLEGRWVPVPSPWQQQQTQNESAAAEHARRVDSGDDTGGGGGEDASLLDQVRPHHRRLNARFNWMLNQ